MTFYRYLPLVFATLLVVVVASSWFDRRSGRLVDRISIAAFGVRVERNERSDVRRRLLRSAHVGKAYRSYAARTVAYAIVLGVAATIVGTYVLVVLAYGSVHPDAFERPLYGVTRAIGDAESVFVTVPFVLLGSAGGGFVTYFATIRLRWWWPSYRATRRERRIEEALPRTVAFMYAMSRSGIAFPNVMAALADNRGVYGGTADEMHVAVRRMKLYGTDQLTALEQIANDTPSETYREFLENLASVLESGASLPEFLSDQYEQLNAEREQDQQRFLENLGIIAEAYVSIFVVGAMLLVTVLVIVGVLGAGDTFGVSQLFIYVVIPLANVVALVYIHRLTETLRISRTPREAAYSDEWLDAIPTRRKESEDRDEGTADNGVDDDATRDLGNEHESSPLTADERNQLRLDSYDRFRGFRRSLRQPIVTLRESPVSILYVAIPIAVCYLLIGAWTVRLRFSDLAVTATLFVLGSFAVTHQTHVRYVRGVERSIPDLLDRLAGVNESGMSLVRSLNRVGATDLGALDREVRSLRRDLQWGADVESALFRLENRVRTAAITRVVTLLSNAARVTGDLGPVLRIAADEAIDQRQLDRRRRQEILTYLVIVYLSFTIFLVIVFAVVRVLLPSIPAVEATPLLGIGGVEDIQATQAAFTTLLYHTALIQGLFAGLIAGLLGEESILAGVKHAVVLVGLAYVAFMVV